MAGRRGAAQTRLGLGLGWACLISSALAATSARADDVVVVVGVGDDASAVDAQAQQVRAALPTGVVHPSLEAAREGLAPPGGPVTELAQAQGTLDAADVAFNAAELERSVTLLDALIKQLEVDAAFSAEKGALLEKARLSCARRLLGLAGPTETGKGETKNGARARAHLAAAVRADPTLVLDDSAPPKLRSLLALAVDDVKKGGHGAVAVKSTPSGAAVVLEGKTIGYTPLVTASTVATGRYRLWVEKNGQKSHVRTVDVSEATLGADIALVIEGAVRFPEAGGIGLRRPLTALSADDLSRLALKVGAQKLALVGDDQGASFTIVSDDKGRVIGSASGLDVNATAAFIAAPTMTSPAPAWLVESLTSTSPAGPGADEGPPWALIGAGVGGAVLVVGAVIAGVVIAANPQTFVTISVVEGVP